MPSDDCPDDEDGAVRQTYNFAPGSHGLVYRADVPDHGAGKSKDSGHDGGDGKDTHATDNTTVDGSMTKETKYKLQGMKWGLIPFWTKRSPDYGSMMRTINARDDSLAANGGMWNTMKQKKRCIVVCEGFYEWLKKNNGKDKIPHFIKRKDGQLMCFAGLWDCVKYEGQDEKLYTYTIITTDSNKQMSWLHDRMPVILDPGSDKLKTWLDPGRAEWSKELQSILKPYTGELEIYPVDKAVGKVGNNSPSFVVPVDSKENKNNIANFFGNQKKLAKGKAEEKAVAKVEDEIALGGTEVKKDDDSRDTEVEVESTEDNAPLPKPEEFSEEVSARGIKRERTEDDSEPLDVTPKVLKTEDNQASRRTLDSPEAESKTAKKSRSAVSNGSANKSPSKAAAGSQKITSFFGK
jgi:putative SOS response-associated peptidase YedK